MTDDDVPRLESIAQQLIGRIHDDDPMRVWPWLAYVLPDPKDWYRLCYVLACAVPTDRTWGELTDWARVVDNPVDTAPAGRKTTREGMGTGRPTRREAA